MSAGELFLTDKLKESSWRLVQRQSAPASRAASQVVTYGPAYWMATFSYQNLTDSNLRALTAWLARRQGSRVSFTAFRPARKQPLAGPSVNNSGIAVDDYDTGAGTIDFTGLPCDMSAGDMVSYYTAASGFYLGEVLADASELSGAATVSVHPAPVAPHASLSAPRIVQALAEMQLEGLPDVREVVSRAHSVSFTARQVERY